MKKFQVKLLLIFCTLFAFSTISFASETSWLDNFEKAKEISAQTNRPILTNFSGSDWCYWCKKLDKEVFNQKDFQNYASDNLVLFQADFPRGKRLSAEITKQNEQLARQYGVLGFPTVLLLDSSGKVIARTGYKAGGADSYIKHIQSLLKTK